MIYIVRSNVLMIAITFQLLLITCVMLLNAIHQRYVQQPVADLLPPPTLAAIWSLVALNTMIALALGFMVACRSRGVHTSGVISLFFLLLALCGVPEFIDCVRSFDSSAPVSEVQRTSAIHHNRHLQTIDVQCALFLIYYLFVALLLILCGFADKFEHNELEASLAQTAASYQQVTHCLRIAESGRRS